MAPTEPIMMVASADETVVNAKIVKGQIDIGRDVGTGWSVGEVKRRGGEVDDPRSSRMFRNRFHN